MEPGAWDSPRLGQEREHISRTQFIRIIIQSLYDLGYPHVAEHLEVVSGIRLLSQEYLSLADQIQAGRWVDCIRTINSLSILNEETRVDAAFLVWEEHFLELLSGSAEGEQLAFSLLRQYISPLKVDRQRVNKLVSNLLFTDSCHVRDTTESRKKLLKNMENLLPNWFRVPEGRLLHLVESTIMNQVDNCSFHCMDGAISLYEKHRCYPGHLPCEIFQIVHGHKDQICFVQFSNNGKYLASTSRDRTVIIWVVNKDDTITLMHTLGGHKRTVSFAAWSPDDTMLLTCSNEEVLRLWNVKTGMWQTTFRCPEGYIINSCAWLLPFFKDFKWVVYSTCRPDDRIDECGIQDWEPEDRIGQQPDSCIVRSDLGSIRQKVLNKLPSVSGLGVILDGSYLVSSHYNGEIFVHDTHGENFATTNLLLPNEHERRITSLSVAGNGCSVIFNLKNLIYVRDWNNWNMTGRRYPHIKHTYEGHTQNRHSVRSCFGGGSHNSFIASGSEDSQIYFWHMDLSKPFEILPGHSNVVKCVSWNMNKPWLLASASADCTIRIWRSRKSIHA